MIEMIMTPTEIMIIRRRTKNLRDMIREKIAATIIDGDEIDQTTDAVMDEILEWSKENLEAIRFSDG